LFLALLNLIHNQLAGPDVRAPLQLIPGGIYCDVLDLFFGFGLLLPLAILTYPSLPNLLAGDVKRHGSWVAETRFALVPAEGFLIRYIFVMRATNEFIPATMTSVPVHTFPLL